MRIDFTQLIGGKSEDPLIEPRKIFSTLLRKSLEYPYLRDVQSEVLDVWFSRRNEQDLVLKMSTGAGKTVVGLLILQSCLNEKKGPAIYAAPDRFLCNQVCSQAGDLGISVTDDCDSLQFTAGESILVIPIHKLLNGRSIFGVGSGNRTIGSLLLDDAHACLAIAESQFTLRVPASHDVYKKLFWLFAHYLGGQSQSGLMALQDGDARRMMLVPFWAWIDKTSEVLKCLHPYRHESDFQFTLPLLEESIELCQCLFTGAALEISCRCLPIERVPSFVNAERRVYMTATLVDDSCLITAFNVNNRSVSQPITPKSAGDLGDRMILTPQRLNPKITDEELRRFIMEYSREHNVVVITPSNHRAAFWKDVADTSLKKDTIREGIDQLRKEHVGLVVLSNKYEGIDLPDDACRLLVLDGLPEVRRYMDRYEQSVLAEGDEILIRQIQRIEQGMGRGVRSNNDYCVVMIMGRKLMQVLFSKGATAKFSPATAAQMKVAENLANQIPGVSLSELSGVISMCLGRHPGWVKAAREALVNITYQTLVEVSEVAIAQRKAFDLAKRKQFENAADVIQELVNAELDPKIQNWLKHQLAEYTHHFNQSEAQRILLSTGTLSTALTKPREGIAYKKLEASTINQASRAASFLRKKGSKSNEIVIWLHGLIDDLNFQPDNSNRFEEAIALLSLCIGFDSQRPEKQFGKGPDNLWALGDQRYLIIECKSGSTSQTVAKRDIDQLAGSLNSFRSRYDHNCKVLPILIHPKAILDRTASPPPGLRIIDEEFLEQIRKELLNYIRMIGSCGGPPNKNQLSEFFNSSNFTRDNFLSKLTRAPKPNDCNFALCEPSRQQIAIRETGPAAAY